MASFGTLLSKWPLIRQIREGKDGTGLESMSDQTRAMHARIDGAQVARSVCPYCGVGCGQLIYHRDGKLISIEGDPESPISQGNLCPKGAASYQLLTHDRRETKMKYRAPRDEGVDGNFAGSRDGHGSGPRLGIAQAHLRAQEKWRDDQSHDSDLPSRWRHARQRRKLSHSKTIHARPGDGLYIQPGADMT